ncbi:MAG: HAD family hydrolase [Dehalococcoidia bacterium]
MKYRLIAFDLDGTLRSPQYRISQRTKEAIARAMAAGAEITIATGRMFQATLPFATELNIRTPIICYQGALIGDPVSRAPLWHKPIPLPLARRAIEVIESVGLHVNAYVEDELYVRTLNETAQKYMIALDVKAHPVGDLNSFLSKEPTKLAAIGEEGKIDSLVRDFSKAFGSSLMITKPYPTLCEIGHPTGSKGQALAYLANFLEIPREEVVAFGDSPNDVDMLRWAGLAVAMADAPPEVVEVADLVAAPVAEDGAARVVEDLLGRGSIGVELPEEV